VVSGGFLLGEKSTADPLRQLHYRADLWQLLHCNFKLCGTIAQP